MGTIARDTISCKTPGNMTVTYVHEIFFYMSLRGLRKFCTRTQWDCERELFTTTSCICKGEPYVH